MISDSVQTQGKWAHVDTFGQELHVNSIVVRQGILFAGSDGELSSWDVTDLTKIHKITSTALNGIVTSIRFIDQKILAIIVNPNDSSRNQLIRFDAKTLSQEAVIADGVLDYTLNGNIVFCVKGKSTIYNYNINTGKQISACNIKPTNLNGIVYSRDPLYSREELLCAICSEPSSLVVLSGRTGLQQYISPLSTSFTNITTTKNGCIVTYGLNVNHTPCFQVWDPKNLNKETKVDVKDSFKLIPTAFKITDKSIFMALKSEDMGNSPGIKVFKNNATLEESAFLSRGGFQPRSLTCAGDDLIFVGIEDPITGAGGIDIWKKYSAKPSVQSPEKYGWKKREIFKFSQQISLMIPVADKIFTVSNSKLTRWDFTEQKFTGLQDAVLDFSYEIKNLTYFNGYLYGIIAGDGVQLSKMVKIDPNSLKEVKSVQGVLTNLQFYSFEDMLFVHGPQDVRKIDPYDLSTMFVFTTVDPITSIKMVGDTLVVAGDSHMATYDPIDGAVKSIVETTFKNPRLTGPIGKTHFFVTEWHTLHAENLGIYSVDRKRAITAQTLLMSEFGSTSVAIFKDQIILNTREGLATFSNDIDFKRMGILSHKNNQTHIEKIDENTFFSSHKIDGFRASSTVVRIWKRAFQSQ